MPECDQESEAPVGRRFPMRIVAGVAVREAVGSPTVVGTIVMSFDRGFASTLVNDPDPAACVPVADMVIVPDCPGLVENARRATNRELPVFPPAAAEPTPNVVDALVALVATDVRTSGKLEFVVVSEVIVPGPESCRRRSMAVTWAPAVSIVMSTVPS